MEKDKLTYEDLKLGQKAKEMYLKGEPISKIIDTSAVYLNTREIIYGANVTDAGIAAILAGLPLLLIGKPGCGKSQKSSDISRYYFGGTGKQGLAVEIDGTKKELDIYEEIFTQLNREKLQREFSDKINRCYFGLEEINRPPEFAQNQFLNLAMGRTTSPSGDTILLGKNGYSICLATANMGNGDYMGTFSMDKALRNRFGVVLDFNYEQFKPTLEDLVFISELRQANPGVKLAPVRDISDKIIEANREITNSTLDLGTEAKAVLYFLQFGLKNCIGDGKNLSKATKGVAWPKNCAECKTNSSPSSEAICSLIREIDGRTVQVLPKYAAALNYLIKLKNPKISVDATELMFKAFELTGAYQDFLNPFILHQKYDGQHPLMMADVVNMLKENYLKQKDNILSCIEASKSGLNPMDLFELKSKDNKTKQIRQGYSEISSNGTKEKLQEKGYTVTPIQFTDQDTIGYSWVPDVAKIIKTFNEIEKTKTSDRASNSNESTNKNSNKSQDGDKKEV
ncbi:MAG: hypothetical protein ACP5OG_06270 [Candidatus Nanoarchaeia archaeon]